MKIILKGKKDKITQCSENHTPCNEQKTANKQKKKKIQKAMKIILLKKTKLPNAMKKHKSTQYI